MVARLLLVGLLLSLSPSLAAGDTRIFSTAQKSGTEVTLMGIYFHDVRLGWAVGSGGAIVKTTDGGKRWRRVPSGTQALMTNVFFADAKHGWAIGANGTILATRDGGEKWTPQVSGTQV